MTLRERISKAPWKEFMIGEGLLSLSFGCVLLFLAFTSTDVVYDFIHNLDQIKVKNLLFFGAEAVFSVGFLLIGLPLLIFSFQSLLASQITQENSD